MVARPSPLPNTPPMAQVDLLPGAEQLAQVQRQVQRINAGAQVHLTTRSRIDMSLVLGRRVYRRGDDDVDVGDGDGPPQRRGGPRPWERPENLGAAVYTSAGRVSSAEVLRVTGWKWERPADLGAAVYTSAGRVSSAELPKP